MNGWMGFLVFPSIRTKDKNIHPNSSNVVPLLAHTKSQRRKLEGT
jgi:hypothetical protein